MSQVQNNDSKFLNLMLKCLFTFLITNKSLKRNKHAESIDWLAEKKNVWKKIIKFSV